MELRDLIEVALAEDGEEMGVERLAVMASVSPTTIRKVRAGHIPLAKTEREIALACDRMRREARKTGVPTARETA